MARVALGMLLSTLTEAIVPVFAGHLVDSLGRGPSALDAALSAFAVMAGLGLLMIGLRHVAWSGIVPLTLGMMRHIVQDTFHRVQRFSTDWHNNSFAGSTVRKITRGMWALDSLNDMLLLALLPAFVVLVSAVILLGAHWPIMGAIMAVGALAYTALAVGLATHVIAPASRLSNALDTRIGGVLSDALGANSVVKSFGAEAREDARLSRVVEKWSRRTRRTWMRHTWNSTGQLALLWIVRTAVTGTALWLWWRGRATAWRDHVRAHDLFCRARVSARYRPAHSPVAACGQRNGGDGALVWPAPRRCRFTRCKVFAHRLG